MDTEQLAQESALWPWIDDSTSASDQDFFDELSDFEEEEDVE